MRQHRRGQPGRLGLPRIVFALALGAAWALAATSRMPQPVAAAQAPDPPKTTAPPPPRKGTVRPSRPGAPAPRRPAPRSSSGRSSSAPGPLPATPPAAPDEPAQQVPGHSPTEGAQLDQDLITRYRFSERYGSNVEVSEDGRVGQYRVAIRDTIRAALLKAEDSPVRKTGVSGKSASGRSAPAPPGSAGSTAARGGNAAAGKAGQAPAASSEVGFQDKHIIYADRAAEVSGLGQVKSLIRRYERARLSSDPNAEQAPAPHSVEGLTIWYRPQIDPLPLVLSLTPNRALTESDYRFTASQLFVPNLANLLPSTPVRIGDNWQISKLAVKTLLGAERVAEGGLTARLAEIRKDTRGSARDRVAIIDVTGNMVAQMGYGAMKMKVRAQIEFAFTPPRTVEADPSKPRDVATVDARGAIVWLSLIQEGVTAAVSRLDPRPRTVKRELVLERQLTNAGIPLELPREAPKPTPENSWLLYTDRQGRFRFRHSQEFHHPRDYELPQADNPDQVELIHLQLGRTAPDRVLMDVSASSKRDPEELRSKVAAIGREGKLEVLQGTVGWLPDIDWPGMRVYRYENAFKGATARGVQRIHSDSYLIQFPGREGSLVVTATTGQDPPLQFRKDVEEMLKTFEWAPDSGEGSSADASPTPAPAQPAGAAGASARPSGPPAQAPAPRP